MIKHPYFSVVIICYNGATTLGRTIESLLTQSYDKRRYEIIIVDDGSTDATAGVAAEYPVRYHRQENGGVSSARNAGIALANGDVYVAMDCDVIAAPNFLEELAKAYAHNHQVAGIGGTITRLETEPSLIQAYIGATGQGPAPRLSSNKKSGLVGRFIRYVAGRLVPSAVAEDEIEVEELFGANGSFPMDVVKAVGGWDVAMSGIEDRDISYRIKARFPDHKFIAVRTAELIHDPDLSMRGYMMRGWKRGPISLSFYQRQMMTPPIFPFPVAILGVCFLAVAFNDDLLPFALLALPQALYFWWPTEAVRKLNPVYLLFPYLQLVEESMVILGLLRGYLPRRGVSNG
jgi:glycosyltransferase involved in cell wall biosynthesis